MDSFQTFLDIFRRAKEENDSTGLTEILTTSRTYFQNVSKDESGMYKQINIICCFIMLQHNILILCYSNLMINFLSRIDVI